MVREAVARHLGDVPTSASQLPVSFTPDAHASRHASHSVYAGLVNVSDACLIEPAVPCDHCGYCKSHGH